LEEMNEVFGDAIDTSSPGKIMSFEEKGSVEKTV